MSFTKCKLYKDGNCDKWITKHKCKPSDISWLDEHPEFVSVDRMCENASIFGNVYAKVTKEDLARLLNGEVIKLEAEEYTVFIGYVEEDTK